MPVKTRRIQSLPHLARWIDFHSILQGLKAITVNPLITTTIREADNNNRLAVDVVRMVEVVAGISGAEEVTDSSRGTKEVNGTNRTETCHHHHTHLMDRTHPEINGSITLSGPTHLMDHRCSRGHMVHPRHSLSQAR